MVINTRIFRKGRLPKHASIILWSGALWTRRYWRRWYIGHIYIFILWPIFDIIETGRSIQAVQWQRLHLRLWLWLWLLNGRRISWRVTRRISLAGIIIVRWQIVFALPDVACLVIDHWVLLVGIGWQMHGLTVELGWKWYQNRRQSSIIER